MWKRLRTLLILMRKACAKDVDKLELDIHICTGKDVSACCPHIVHSMAGRFCTGLCTDGAACSKAMR